MAITEIPTCLRTCALTSQSGWMSLAGGIMITVALAIAVVFMLSRLFNKRDWEAVARMEAYHLVIAVIWISIIAVVANTTCSISCSITKDESPFLSAINYINSVNQKLNTLFTQLYEKARNIRIESSYSFSVVNMYYSPVAGCDNVANTYENFAFIISPFIASMIIQQYVLILINQLAFTFLLPLGIVLKLIPGLRDASSYIIGIAFALYIVFPLTYIFAEKATQGISISPIDTDAGDCISANEMQTILRNIGSVLPQAVFFPALSSIITIGAARAFAEVFKYDFAELRGE